MARLLHRCVSRWISALLIGTLLVSTAVAQNAREPTGRQRGMLLALAFSNDGALLVTGGDSVRVYDVESADVVEKWESPPLIRAVSFSPTEARVLAEAGDNGAIRFRRISEKEPFRVIQAHAGRIAKLAFSPSGKLGISTATVLGEGAPVAELRIWNVETGEIIRKIDWDEVSISCAAFSHDGKFVAVATTPRREEETFAKDILPIVS